MLASKFESTPSFGFIQNNYKRFNDAKLFDKNRWVFSRLQKIKIWYGTPIDSESYITTKSILGIQCEYLNLLNRKQITTEQHCGKLISDDIIVKELKLEKDDYFIEFSVCFDDIISYVKIATFQGKSLELGTCDENLLRKISLKKNENYHIISCFYGFIDDVGLRAVGYKHIGNAIFTVYKAVDIFRLRHIFKTNEDEKEKWKDNEKINQLNENVQVFVRLCLLPDTQFSNVIKFI